MSCNFVLQIFVTLLFIVTMFVVLICIVSILVVLLCAVLMFCSSDSCNTAVHCYNACCSDVFILVFVVRFFVGLMFVVVMLEVKALIFVVGCLLCKCI